MSSEERPSAEPEPIPFSYIPDLPWMNRAKCRTMNPDIFFGKEYEGMRRHRPSLTSVEVRRAKAICATCPVLWDCFKWAMEQEEEYGVWGGTTRRERKRLREGAATTSAVAC